jgi:hypothetical protein
MTDRREDILTRLATVCGAVDGVASAVRNRLDVTKLQRPAVAIFDAAEQLLDQPMSSRGIPGHSEIQRMELSPLISIHIRGTDSVDAGMLLSLYRSRLLAAVLNDPVLLAACSPNGSIRYEGATVAPPAAEGNEHRIDLALVFTYVFRLADITP